MDKQLNDLWNTVLTEMKTKSTSGHFAGFVKQSMLISVEGDRATIAVHSVMARNMMQRSTGDLEKLLSEKLKKQVIVQFIVKTIPREMRTGDAGPLFETDQVASDNPIKKPTPTTMVGHLPRVRPEYTFSTFAVSSTNNLAFVSAQRVASNIGQSYNPLFIYGPVGVGKTHLMHAIANTVYQKDPAKKIIYITSEEFTNEVVEAIRTNETAKMKRRFRSAYILIIDDIQFIEGKEKVQEELFHTFNILIDNGSQICLTSDRPPHEIKKLEKRLSSRFAGGLTVDIGEPDLELKTAILKKKAEKYGYELPIDVGLFLAEKVTDTRSLEGLLLRVITQATTSQQPISLELTKLALGAGATEEKRNGQVRAEDVIEEACAYFHIKQTLLRGQKRDASLVRARQVVMYILYTKMGVTYVRIGDLLGGRDHTTIMHGVEKITALVDNKDEVYGDIERIMHALNG